MDQQLGKLPQPRRLVHLAGARQAAVQLLQRDDVRFELEDHPSDALEIHNPVGALSVTDVVGRDPEYPARDGAPAENPLEERPEPL